LGLQVGRKGAELDVSWNVQSDAVKQAKGGFLSIVDGAHRTHVFLDEAQLKAGRVLYASRTADTDIRLEVIAPDDRLVAESLRVLQAGVLSQVEDLPPNAGPATPVRTSSDNGLAAWNTRQRSVSVTEERSNAGAPAERKIFLPPVNATAAKPEPAIHIESTPPPLNTSEAPIHQASILPGIAHRPVDPPPVSKPPIPMIKGPTVHRLEPPVPTKKVRFIVPEVLRKVLRNEVTVQLNLSIDETGRVLTAVPLETRSSLEGELAKLATSVARNWRFKPGTEDGKPIASNYSLVFHVRP
jgi:hypothetical protein